MSRPCTHGAQPKKDCTKCRAERNRMKKGGLSDRARALIAQRKEQRL